ncbi:hypothetical protein ACFTZB_19905 [Rhodococcus sp. NPDC057014]|uniref:hypothetical protein n=1 Tax=Rhodococcus sp. NPDC057014 TaxID=3346000 RepID=UPI00363D341E
MNVTGTAARGFPQHGWFRGAADAGHPTAGGVLHSRSRSTTASKSQQRRHRFAVRAQRLTGAGECVVVVPAGLRLRARADAVG